MLKEMRAALDKWIMDTKDLGEVPEQELIKRGLVRDLLNTEYDGAAEAAPEDAAGAVGHLPRSRLLAAERRQMPVARPNPLVTGE